MKQPFLIIICSCWNRQFLWNHFINTDPAGGTKTNGNGFNPTNSAKNGKSDKYSKAMKFKEER